MREDSVTSSEQVSKDNIRTILAACRDNQVNGIYVAFFGGGDDGQIDSVEFYRAPDPDNAPILIDDTSSMRVTVRKLDRTFNQESSCWDTAIVDAEVSLDDAVYDLVNALAENCDVNWYDGDGGSGFWSVTDILTGNPSVQFSVSQYETVSNTVLEKKETVSLEAEQEGC